VTAGADGKSGSGAPAWLNVFADRPAQLEAKPEHIEAHRRLVRELTRLFGSRHYRHYDFLLAVSDQFSGVGLEHLQSSENGVDADYFTEWDTARSDRDLLAHEMTHSWNGKFRRPADLWTPNYNVPMRNSLLWVYEGMTEYWGIVLAARSGLWSEAYTRDALALIAASFGDQRPGREWRSLGDTTNQPIMAYQRTLPYNSWQRINDYYQEGLLLWLDADTRLRELTHEQRSLDDFAAAFAGIQDGQPGPSTFTFDDLVATLDGVARADWRALLRARVDGHIEAGLREPAQ
jgi:predicted metalloprotease with PDZ domain